MANPEFSFLYNVTIRQYKNESLFNDLESDEVDVLVLANGLREATDKAEDYAEAVNQNGPYKFYDVVAVEEIDTVYTGNDYDPEDNYVENPDETEYAGCPCAVPNFNDPSGTIPENGGYLEYKAFYVNTKTGEKILVYPGWIFPQDENPSDYVFRMEQA